MVFIYRSGCIYFVLRQKQWKVETVFNNRSNRKIVYVTDFSNIIRKNISVTNLRNLIKTEKHFIIIDVITKDCGIYITINVT